tara:strand:- start:454 stop:642 length:189 start_codon:yes stop_codon:yes gene_type:complete
MTTDVMQKCITANTIENGSAVMGVDKNGNNHTIAPKINKAPDVDAMDTKFTDKFDDYMYYSN